MADEATILTEAQQLKLNGAKVRTMCQMAPRAHSRDPGRAQFVVSCRDLK